MPNYERFKGDEEDSEDYDPGDGRSFLGVPSTEKKQRKSAAGRKLVRWSCETDQLVLLCVDYVCTKQGIAIPWDLVGKEINDTLTGEAIKQHLVKVRKARELHGQQVPPKLEPTERRRPVDDYVPVTPVKAPSEKTRSEHKIKTSEKPLRNLVYISDKKNTPIRTRIKKAGGVSAENNISATVQRSTKSGSGWKAEPGSVTRGSKRNRTTQKRIKQEEDRDSDFESPPKKFKVAKEKAKPQFSGIVKLRILTQRNYTEPAFDDDDMFTSEKDSPRAKVPSQADAVHTSGATSSGHSDVSRSSKGINDGWSTAPWQYDPGFRSTSVTHTTPPHVTAGRANGLFQGPNAGPSPAYEENYTMANAREGGTGLIDYYGGNRDSGSFVYNDEATAPRTIRGEVSNTLEYQRGGRTPRPFQMFGNASDVATSHPTFENFNELSSPLSSQSSFSNGDPNAEPEIGTILIGNDTGRGDTVITPTTVTFGLGAGARIGGLPQPYSLGGDSSLTFNQPLSTHDSHDATQYYSGTTAGRRSTMAYGMSNLGLNSGPTNPGPSFDRSYSSFNNTDSQDFEYNPNSYSSDPYNALAYERQMEGDDVFGSALINMYGDEE